MKPRRSIRATAPALAGALLTALAAGCGSSGTGAAVTYAPAAYGVPAAAGHPGYCYWIDYPDEAAALIAAGLCQHGWVPMQAPLSWQQEYYAYYDSPAYYSVYVPTRYRTVYVSRQTTFYTKYKTTIVVAERSATYKGSNGSTLKGSTSSLKFTSGSGSTTRNGGGSARGGTSVRGCSLNLVTLTDRSSGSSGGGSARGGTSVSGGSRSGSSGTSGSKSGSSKTGSSC